MEEALANLQSLSEISRRNEAIKVLKIYVNNVVDNPDNLKYRKIRINNPKFHSAVWSIEYARSFLLLAGFEENDGYLVLPQGVQLDGVKLMLDKINVTNIASENEVSEQPQSSTSSSLKLRDDARDNSMFDEEIKADLTLLSYMNEMGFDMTVAEKALIITKNKGIQPAIDWINNNPSKVDEIRITTYKQHLDGEKSTNQEKIPQLKSPKVTVSTDLPNPVSRFQATIDERHKFQEKLRLEAIEAARMEKLNKKREKENLMKNLEDQKRERKEKDSWSKCMRKNEAMTSPPSTSQAHHDGEITIKLRLPDGQVQTLNTVSKTQLKEIYKEVSGITKLEEDHFILVLLSSHAKLTDKDKCLDDLGFKSHEIIVVQHKNQIGSLTQGEGVFYQIVDIETREEFEKSLWKNNDKLVVAQLNKSQTTDMIEKEFEDLAGKYGVHKKAIFLRVNTDQVGELKVEYNVSIFPTYLLFRDRERVDDVRGHQRDVLETLIKNNISGPLGRNVDEISDEAFYDSR